MSFVAELNKSTWRSIELRRLASLVEEINDLGTGDTLALRLDPKGVIVSSHDCDQRQHWQESVFWDNPRHQARLITLAHRLTQIRNEMELNMENDNACTNP